MVRTTPSSTACRERACRDLQLPSGVQLGVGIDRLDYTKGINEKFLAIERLLEARPEIRGHFVFVQVAEPSRDCLPAQWFEGRYEPAGRPFDDNATMRRILMPEGGTVGEYDDATPLARNPRRWPTGTCILPSLRTVDADRSRLASVSLAQPKP
jgi:hypothetical protein